ncbi:hypothetical protein OF83DRAFT_1054763 [Amylostereum chailletii]|nr:hypothetical protein OF83DRAFT_1054763 [Amylostereum chailletii]
MNPTQADFLRATRNVQANPAQSLRNAKGGSMLDIKVIANNIQAVPQLQTFEVVEMFCSHLDASKTPDPRLSAAPHSPATIATDRAFSSLLGIGNFGSVLSMRGRQLLAPIEKAWPGIFRWMVFFDTLHRNPRLASKEQRENSQEIIAYALYTITIDDRIQAMVTATPGLVPLATKFWLDENMQRESTMLPVPVGSAALHHVLFTANDDTLNEVVRSAGGKYGTVAQLGIARLKHELKRPIPRGPHVHAYTDVLVTFTRGQDHPLRRAILKAGGMVVVTQALLKLSTQPLDKDVFEGVISCFGFISNLIEAGEGTTYVRQAIQNGLLEAFVNISPSFNLLDPEAHGFTLKLVSNVIPRYLVYRSIILAVNASMTKLETPANRRKIERSPVKKAWYTTKMLALERSMVQHQADIERRERAFCDYCQKGAPKDTFKRCSGCQATLYCSKECQIQGWKSGHKGECKLKDAERINLQNDTMRKDDRMFHHALTIHEAQTHVPQLRLIAEREHPSVPLLDLGVRIDYTVIPPSFSTFVLEEHDISREARPSESRTQEARGEGIVEKAIARRGRSTLIESVISHGRFNTMVMTLAAHSLWEGRNGVQVAGAEGDDALPDEDATWGGVFSDTLETYLRLRQLAAASGARQIKGSAR